MAELLIADDERTLREGYRALFTSEGFSVRTARDGADALAKFAERKPDLVLLDLMMPKMNGFVCCEEIRRIDKHTPILFLTGKDADANLVRGLGCGADDFISKTATEDALVARVRRAVQRTADQAAPKAEGTELALGRMRVNLRRLTVQDESGNTMAHLTRTEGDILRILAERAEEPLTADDLITELRGEGFACEDGMLYSHIHNLRQKLGAAGALIVCNRNAGYRLLARATP